MRHPVYVKLVAPRPRSFALPGSIAVYSGRARVVTLFRPGVPSARVCLLSSGGSKARVRINVRFIAGIHCSFRCPRQRSLAVPEPLFEHRVIFGSG